MNKTLIVKITNVYGIRKVYPVCEQSRTLAQIAGTRTLTDNVIKAAEKLGFTFEVQQEVL